MKCLLQQAKLSVEQGRVDWSTDTREICIRLLSIIYFINHDNCFICNALFNECLKSNAVRFNLLLYKYIRSKASFDINCLTWWNCQTKVYSLKQILLPDSYLRFEINSCKYPYVVILMIMMMENIVNKIFHTMILSVSSNVFLLQLSILFVKCDFSC